MSFLYLLVVFCTSLCLWACSDGGTSEPILYPVGSSAEQQGLSNTQSSSDNFSHSSSSIVAMPCKTESEDNCEYGTLVDERDGQIYKTVRIGNQIWMAENLNYAYLQPIAELDSSSWCYDNDPENCKKFGRLYLWMAAVDSAAMFSFDYSVNCKMLEWSVQCSPDTRIQGACPSGWHLPLESEWFELYGNTGDSSLNLKSNVLWKEGEEGLDRYGFNALPSGYIQVDRKTLYFHQMGVITDFWTTSTDELPASPAYFYLDHDFAIAGYNYALPVRCLKDTVFGLNFSHGSMMDSRDGQVYKTVSINGKTWMAENLNYAYLQPTLTLDSSSWCYDNEQDSCSKYGRLYLWSAAMDSAALFGEMGKDCGNIRREILSNGNVDDICVNVQKNVRGVCPENWHIPSKAELDALAASVNKFADLLKSADGWENDENGSDTFGMNIYPSGQFQSDESLGSPSFRYSRYGAYFWSSTAVVADPAKYGYRYVPTFAMKLWADFSQIIVDYSEPSNGYSVRCVKDIPD